MTARNTKTRVTRALEADQRSSAALPPASIEVPPEYSTARLADEPFVDRFQARLNVWLRNNRDCEPTAVILAVVDIACSELEVGSVRGVSDAVKRQVVTELVQRLRSRFEQRENPYSDRSRWMDRHNFELDKEDELESFLRNVYPLEMRERSLNLTWLRKHDPTLYQVLRRYASKNRTTPADLPYVESQFDRHQTELESFPTSESSWAHRLYARRLRRLRAKG